MKKKLLKKVGIISLVLCMGAVCACGNKEEQDEVKVEIEKIDRSVNDINNNIVEEDKNKSNISNTMNDKKNGVAENKHLTITPSAHMTEEDMLKIVEEQKAIMKEVDIMDPNLKNEAPGDIKPNFGPDGFGEKELIEKGNMDPNIKPNFPTGGVKVEKNGDVDIKPNFPSEGQEVPVIQN